MALDVVNGRAVAARSVAIGMKHAMLQQRTVSAADTVVYSVTTTTHSTRLATNLCLR